MQSLLSDGLHSTENPATLERLANMHPQGPAMDLASLPNAMDGIADAEDLPWLELVQGAIR